LLNQPKEPDHKSFIELISHISSTIDLLWPNVHESVVDFRLRKLFLIYNTSIHPNSRLDTIVESNSTNSTLARHECWIKCDQTCWSSSRISIRKNGSHQGASWSFQFYRAFQWNQLITYPISYNLSTIVYENNL